MRIIFQRMRIIFQPSLVCHYWLENSKVFKRYIKIKTSLNFQNQAVVCLIQFIYKIFWINNYFNGTEIAAYRLVYVCPGEYRAYRNFRHLILPDYCIISLYHHSSIFGIYNPYVLYRDDCIDVVGFLEQALVNDFCYC